MRNIYLITAALASMILASCMNEEFVGDTPQTGKAEELNAIAFNGGTSALTRADFTGAQAAEKLGNQFLVYGVKQDKETSKYKEVFGNFTMKYDTGKADNADYNNGWYYAGIDNQTIRYWDYSALGYHFVAGSPVANFTYAVDETTKDIKTATITGLGGRLNHETTVASTLAPVYIAEPKNVAKPTGTKYGEVEFTFKSMQSKVRVGIYETIPGYKITDIKFYQSTSATTPDDGKYITLIGTTGYFQGGSGVEGIVTYNWTTPDYTFAYSTKDGKKPTLGNYWEGGQFTDGVKATKSTDAVANLYGADGSMASDGYFIVMPTPSATAAVPLTIKCDYTLTSDDEVDVINVTGASATIPAAYTKWATNTAYTYLFKITDNTNGTTGPDPDDPTGLYPITFDAVVVNVADAGQIVGTETTVSTPSITVTQNGNVVTNGIAYKAGSVTVNAYEGTTDVTSSATWSYIELTGEFDYGSDYEKLGTYTSGKLTTVAAGKTYVIKAVTTNGTAYFVLAVPAE